MRRDTYIDSAKTVLIFLVVFGHCLVRLGEGKYVNACISIIYLFHMPLFVFFSGFLFNTEQSWGRVFRGCLEFLVTYCLFQTFLMLINNVPFTIRNFLIPQFALWYLLSLAFWRLLLKLFSNVCDDRKVWLLWALTLAIVIGFVPVGRELSLQRTFTFFPFFVIGNTFRNSSALGRIKRVNYKLSALLLIALFFGTLFYVEKAPLWLLCGKTSFYGYHHSSLLLAPFAKMVWFLMVIIVSVCILRLIPDNKCLSMHGSKTLTVYLLHYYPIWILEKYAFQTNNILLLFCMSFVIFVMTLYMHEMKFVRFLINPIKMGIFLQESFASSKK